ncbi:MAG: hypothetical protein EBT03_13070, partial [Betaproteobacteria bacterium]|nr:hypothetical protein [Betaproteobacteria bacterium]
KDPLEEFFQKDDKLAWLRTEVRAAGGDPETVDAALTELLAEKAWREADAQSLVLPGLQTGSVQMPLRTTREGEEVLGSVLDYLRWLGLSNAADEWSHWMREEFRTHKYVESCKIRSDEFRETSRIVYVETKILVGQGQRETPFTNFAGYRLLTKLCLRKSKIAQGLYDQALTVLARVSVGDQTLHETLDANAASSSGEARAFVLGPQEARAQRPPRPAKSTPVDLEAVIRTCADDDVDPQVAERRLAKVAMQPVRGRKRRAAELSPPSEGGVSLWETVQRATGLKGEQHLLRTAKVRDVCWSMCNQELDADIAPPRRDLFEAFVAELSPNRSVKSARFAEELRYLVLAAIAHATAQAEGLDQALGHAGRPGAATEPEDAP